MLLEVDKIFEFTKLKVDMQLFEFDVTGCWFEVAEFGIDIL